MKSLDSLRARLAEVRKLPAQAAHEVAPEIARKLRNDARTRRGNVPAYGRLGNIPITTEVRLEGRTGAAIVVHGPDWVLKKAQELGQVDEWVGLVQSAVRK